MTAHGPLPRRGKAPQTANAHRRRAVDVLANRAIVEPSPRRDLTGGLVSAPEALDHVEYPSLEIELQVWPGEYHQTAPPLARSRSLRYLFNAPR